MTTAISYRRFSSKKQEQGDSLRRQVTLAKAYAKEQGWTLDDRSFEDLGISAFNGLNVREGALGAFLKAVDDGTICAGTVLLVESLDRVTRTEVIDALEIFTSIINRGITLVTINDRQHYSRESIKQNPMQLMISILTLVRANEESATKSIRVKAAKAAALKAGKKQGKCPFWLRQSGDGMSFEIIEEKAELVRTMFRMRLDGIGSLRIAQYLNTEHDFEWGSPQVARTLTNLAVIGTRISQAGHEPLVGFYKPIIEKSMFYEVQKLMTATNKGNHSGRRAVDEPNLFAGIGRCALCGSSLRFFRATPRVSQRYLKCVRSIIRKGCDASYVNYDALEQQVIGWLLMDQDEEVVPILEKKPVRKKAENAAEIKALKDQQARLIDLASRGLMNSQPVVEKMNAIELQIKEYETSILLEDEDGDDRLPAEKAWSLAVRHQDAELGDDKEAWYAVRRELKTAFQKSILAIHVYPERRIDDVMHCKISAQFRGYDGEPIHEYTRPALNNVRGVQNGTKVRQAFADTPSSVT
jgi:DNA invertase Pin-like site-specific DNA recombinase